MRKEKKRERVSERMREKEKDIKREKIKREREV